ncbi:MAG: 2,3-diphosphoglycerate-dependent phosphoglycerate mutase, partial [Acidimicrobiales bacterium]
NRFTGWVDVDLSPTGVREAGAAGELLLAERERTGLDFDTVHTSVLTRAVRTANLVLDVLGRAYLPVTRHWRLNERHYGALQGLNKAETAERHGSEQVALWRRSYDTSPPALPQDDPGSPAFDPRYRLVPRSALPVTECLADVVVRLLPYWEDAIAPELLSGKSVLVVAHGNSLRALLKHLEEVSDEEIVGTNIPTGVPRLYDLDDALELASEPVYLGDPQVVAARAKAVAAQAQPPPRSPSSFEASPVR